MLHKCNVYHLAERWPIPLAWTQQLRALKFSCVMRGCTVSRSNAYVTSTSNGWSKLTKVLKELAVERAGNVLHYRHPGRHRHRYRLKRGCLKELPKYFHSI